jgi:hypothetical protein
MMMTFLVKLSIELCKPQENLKDLIVIEALDYIKFWDYSFAKSSIK